MSPIEHPDRRVLSQRAQRMLASPPMPKYLQEQFVRSAAAYDAQTNPDGYISLCVAENRLVADLMLAKMAECRDVPTSVLGYDFMVGSQVFREQLSRFMGRTFLGRDPLPRHLAVLAGAGSVLEILFHALGDPGDGVLVPTPSYSGFWLDVQIRDELTIIPVHCASGDGFTLTTELLDRAVATADRPVRALLFTTPNNPLGTVYTAQEVEAVARWAEDARIHVVFDEIYALSVFGDRKFTSCARVLPSLGDSVHVVWAFSKDFGASGLRCGVLWSENEALLAAVDLLAYWACCSGDTQFVLGEMVSDEAWVDTYIQSAQSILRDAYVRVTAALADEGIPFIPAEAGFFFLVDLRKFLDEPTWEAEHALWERVLEGANVNLTPGSACHNGEPGFMRLCFAGVPTDAAVEGVRRLAAFLTRSREVVSS